MAPGMSHFGGGPRPFKFDALTALRDWVEKGRAPQRLVTHKVTFVPSRTVAHWTGKGSANDAANFACIVPATGK